MKVNELIEKLKEFNPEWEVHVEACERCCTPPLENITYNEKYLIVILSD